VETGRGEAFSAGDWTWQQVLIAEGDKAAAPNPPSTELLGEAQAAPTPPAHVRRRVHRRDEK
jgi:hypothetical protein